MLCNSRCVWTLRLVACLALLAPATSAFGIAVEVPLSNAAVLNGILQAGTVPERYINDSFTYDPNLAYSNPAALDAANLPATAWNGGADAVWLRDDAITGGELISFDVSLGGGETLDWIDMWGRHDGATTENLRHQNLTLEFFSTTGGAGTSLGVSGLFDGVADKNTAVPGSPYGRFDVSTVLSEADRGLVQSFTIHHPNLPVPNHGLLLTEVRAAFGVPENPDPVVTVDRELGDVILTAGATPMVINSYTIDSAAGALNPSNWDSLASGSTNSSLDADPWVNISGAITNGTNLSEGELPGGDGGYTLAAGTSLNLGKIWSKSPNEDFALNIIDDTGAIITPTVGYEGNGGEAFGLGDLDFDGDVDLVDWEQFVGGIGQTFPTLSGGEAYPMGDLDGDLDVDVDDFRAFEAAYDAANPTSLASALAGVPEPSAMALLAVAGLFCAQRRRIAARGLALMAAAAVALGLGSAAEAQTFTVIEGAANSANNVVTTSGLAGGLPPTNLFDATIAEADIDTAAAVGAEFAGLGQGPHAVFFDYDSSFTANWIAYTQRNSTVDWAGEIEVWVQDETFGDILPTREPDAVAVLNDREASILKSYQLSSTVTGQYVALNILRAPEGTINPGGREFRFLAGPDQYRLMVNSVTGDLTIANDSPLAQELMIDAYSISSASGGLAGDGFTGLAALSGFDAATSTGAGDGWEGGGSDDLLTEAYLLGGSNVGIGESLDIGRAYDPAAGATDLEFSYSLEDGNKLVGTVEYFTPDYLAGDYNDDGSVDAADYTLWRDNLDGDSSALANDDIGGAVGVDHYEQWRENFGFSLPAPATTVPEPQSAAIVLALMTGMALLLRPRTLRATMTRNHTGEDEEKGMLNGRALLTAAPVVVASLAVAILAPAAEGSTPDRLYLLGDNSALATENGASNIGNVIGSQTGTTFDGFSLDHAGDNADLNTFADLEPIGDPRYIDVGSSGLERPGAAAGSVGADLDGNDYLLSTGFGNPSNGDDSYQATISYAGLINHYMQGWARLTDAGSAGDRQTVIRDTDQFRIHIDTDADGVPHWGQHYAFTTQATDAEVVLDEWTHVAQYSNGNFGLLWVNGVIEGAIGGFYQPNGAGPEGGSGAAANSLGADIIDGVAQNFFTGQLDDFSVEVTGDNSGETAGADYGPFNLEVDNDYVAQLVADGDLVPGDVNGDGLVNGDGTGDSMSDDVSFFIDHYLEQKVVNFVVVGDLETRTTMADLNYSGTTNILDWFILVQNHEDTAMAASLDLDALLSGASVPEPSALALAMLAALAAGRRRK